MISTGIRYMYSVGLCDRHPTDLNNVTKWCIGRYNCSARCVFACSGRFDEPLHHGLLNKLMRIELC